MKLAIFVLVFVLGFIGVLLYLLDRGTTTEYAESSMENIKRHDEALVIVEKTPCPDGNQGITDQFVSDLKKKYPNIIFGKKGNQLLVNGFSFECLKSEEGIMGFIEIKDE